MNAHLQPTGSAYFIAKETSAIESHTLSVLVDNEPGVLARVIGLFSGRGYNIESLTVSETEHEAHLSRITIVTRGTPGVLEQIKAQLDRLVPVHRVADLSMDGPHVARELALVKVIGSSLFPPAETPQFLIRIETPDGASLARTDQALRFVDSRLAKEPEILWRASNLGRGNPQIFYNKSQRESSSETVMLSLKA